MSFRDPTSRRSSRACTTLCATTAFLMLLWGGAIPAQAGLPSAELTPVGFNFVANDVNPPGIAIHIPADGVTYTQYQEVFADFECWDDSPDFICWSDDADTGQPIDTTTLGTHSFSVDAEDEAGNTNRRTVSYNVVPPEETNMPVDGAPPTVTISTPSVDAVFARDAPASYDFSCTDDVVVASCVGGGGEASGDTIDTSTLGSYSLTVTATDGAGNTASETVNYTVADQTAPTIYLQYPNDGDVYGQGQVINADYACGDEGGSRLVSCTAPVPNGAPIDTSTLGDHEFKIVATDGAGNSTEVTAAYTVTDQSVPTIKVSSPSNAGTYTQGQQVLADYSCEDEAGGSGVDRCEGTVPDGASIDTSTVGKHRFDVDTTDAAGNQTGYSVRYTVTDAVDPTVAIVTPQDAAVYEQGQAVTADYGCADALGSGIVGCVGTVATGAAVDTATAGAHQFTVTATDHAGRTASKTVSYTVAAPPAPPAAPVDLPSRGSAGQPRQGALHGELPRRGRSVVRGHADAPADCLREPRSGGRRGRHQGEDPGARGRGQGASPRHPGGVEEAHQPSRQGRGPGGRRAGEPGWRAGHDDEGRHGHRPLTEAGRSAYSSALRIAASTGPVRWMAHVMSAPL
jgi:hypothetical protein